jgi:hypothetical protein
LPNVGTAHVSQLQPSSWLQQSALEGVMSALLMLVILSVATDTRALGAPAELAIGATIQVHPEVIEVMRETGLDLSDRRPQILTRELAERADIVVTMGCGEECSYIPGKRSIDWDSPRSHGTSSR